MSLTYRFRPTGWTPAEVGIVLPTLPNSEPSYAVPTPTRTVNVSTEAELTSAFTDIQPGDEIVLDSATTWGQIVLPDHGGTSSEWCAITSSSGVPADGTRITSTDTVATVGHDGNQGIINAENVSGWYIYGLKCETTGDITDGIVIQDSDRVVYDRVWVFAPGDATGANRIRRGVRLNGENCVVKNSRIEGIIKDGTQTQGIGVWDGGGPFRIENNFIEALNQNFLAGGAAPSSLEDNPSDGTIRRNHFYKRPAWSGETGTIMVLEWKAGERWLVEGNVIENDYFGFTVAVKAPTEVQGVAGQRTGDMTFRKNRYIGALEGTGGYTLSRKASQSHTVDAGTYLLEDEWWDPRSGRAIRLVSAPTDVTVRRVTLFGTHSSLEILLEAPDGETARLEIDSYRSRAGSFGLWLTDDDFPNGFPDAYAEHTFNDYWQYWDDDGQDNCDRDTSIPGTLDQAAQDEFFCTQFEADIPSDVGADETAVTNAISGVEESNLPGSS